MNQENEQILSPLHEGRQFSNVQPIHHLVILSLVSFGIYEIYWFYKTWKSIKNYTCADFSPGWRTFGLFIPFYNLVRIDGMFRNDIELLRTKVDGVTLIKKPLLYGLSFFLLSAICLKLPDPFQLLYSISVWPLAVAQGHLNTYWKKGQPDCLVRTKFSGVELALLIIGGLLLILVLIGLLIPE